MCVICGQVESPSRRLDNALLASNPRTWSREGARIWTNWNSQFSTSECSVGREDEGPGNAMWGLAGSLSAAPRSRQGQDAAAVGVSVCGVMRQLEAGLGFFCAGYSVRKG